MKEFKQPGGPVEKNKKEPIRPYEEVSSIEEMKEEYKNWCQSKLASYYNEWQEILNGKYDQSIEGMPNRFENQDKRKAHVAEEIAKMISDTQNNFSHGGFGNYSQDKILENFEKIKEKLYQIADKLDVRELVDGEFPKKEEKEELQIPEFLKLDFED
jgi:hypothetical protein